MKFKSVHFKSLYHPHTYFFGIKREKEQEKEIQELSCAENKHTKAILAKYVDGIGIHLDIHFLKHEYELL